MSHIRKCQVDVKNVNKSLLEEAVKRVKTFLSRELGREIKMVDVVRDYYGRTQKVDIGLNIGVGGYGIVVKDGKIEVVGDDWNQSFKLVDFKNMVVREYKSVALLKALESLGYVGEIKNEGNKNIIRAFRW